MLCYACTWIGDKRAGVICTNKGNFKIYRIR